MERSRQVTVTAALAFVALGGCASTDRLTAQYHEAKRAVGLDPVARPASQVSLIMQRRLANLPDAVNNGSQQPGLPGQVFLIGADGKPVDAVGDLILTVADETPRPPGQPPKTTEQWHFGPDILAKLKVKDDRFGQCYVLFLPWKPEWKDVTRVAVSAEYKEKTVGAVQLHALPVSINLDLGQGPSVEPWKRIEPFVVPPADAKPTTVVPQQPIPISPPVMQPQPQMQPQPAAPLLLPQPTQTPAGPTTTVIPRG